MKSSDSCDISLNDDEQIDLPRTLFYAGEFFLERLKQFAVVRCGQVRDLRNDLPARLLARNCSSVSRSP